MLCLCEHAYNYSAESHNSFYSNKKKVFFQKVDGLQLCFALMVIHLFFFSAFMKLMYKHTHTRTHTQSNSNLPRRVSEKTSWATNTHTAHYMCTYTANIYIQYIGTNFCVACGFHDDVVYNHKLEAYRCASRKNVRIVRG